MATKSHYSSYVTDKGLIDLYNTYQNKYKEQPKECDKVIYTEIGKSYGSAAEFSLLDVGCSTGNFLRHAKRIFPNATLSGCDLAVPSVQSCRNDKELSKIYFHVSDVLDLSKLTKVNIVTAMAVAVYFDWPDYSAALKSIFNALRPGGTYYAFEWIHPFSVQDLTIVETSEWNPDGLTIRFRPMKKVEEAVIHAGFESVEFRPFTLPMDLPFPGHDADVVTYTRKDEHGERMAFRGALFQPWCHMIARKAK
jgi:SAM-dependent methyltransferase